MRENLSIFVAVGKYIDPNRSLSCLPRTPRPANDRRGIYTSSSFPHNLIVRLQEFDLVGESVDRLVRVLADLLVGALEPDTHNPGSSRTSGRESGAGGEGNRVARGIFVHP